MNQMFRSFDFSVQDMLVGVLEGNAEEGLESDAVLENIRKKKSKKQKK